MSNTKMSQKALRVVIISRQRKATVGWGIEQDARIVEQVLKETSISGHRIDSIDHIDALSFCGTRTPKSVDIQIHLEVPCRAAWPWGKMNVLVVNPEWWPTTAWNWVLNEKRGADLFIFKSEHARQLFPELDGSRVRVIHWRTSPERQTSLSNLQSVSKKRRREFLYLIGSSENKLRAAERLCHFWNVDWPAIHIVGSEGVLEKLSLFNRPNIHFLPVFQKDEDRIAFQKEFDYHVVLSAAEGFGYTINEAAALGAIPLWNSLPVYSEYIGSMVGQVGRVSSTEGESGYRDSYHTFTESALKQGVESILCLTDDESARIRGLLRHVSTTRVKEFRQKWKTVVGTLFAKIGKRTHAVIPPVPIPAADLPHVAILTITRNRPKWFANMARNILLSDYPPDKMTWVLADDGDGGGRVDEAIMKFQSANPRISVKYLSIVKPMAIGAKRNKACDAAPPEASIFVMMDDDDHYPAGSIHRRVAWLTATGAGCVYCSTLPMYDCTKYISAINVPPLSLSACERVSEATLACTRTFWEAGKFPQNVSVAEGEGFLEGRDAETVEIPPEGIIVSFLHGSNATSRRVPESTVENGCHYGFDDDYFTYISGLGLN